MNAIKASERLGFLNNAIVALGYAIDEASWRQDVLSRHALKLLREELFEERDDLHERLSGVSI